jgi:diadenosine tetraphosphate (Ap4A) HIT family hydrolase
MKKKSILRSEEVNEKYSAYKAAMPADAPHFYDWAERVVAEFDKWVLINNAFPFDKIADTHHLLIPHRVFAHLHEANPEELRELEEIKAKLASDYDFVMENFPRNRSVPTHFHLHFVVLKQAE